MKNENGSRLLFKKKVQPSFECTNLIGPALITAVPTAVTVLCDIKQCTRSPCVSTQDAASLSAALFT
jgi:hypothetical protein